FDFIELTSEYAIYEIPILPQWINGTISSLNIRNKYKINIIAVKNENTLKPMPGVDYVFKENDHVVVIGKSTDVFRTVART
ncbi:MAG: TrkA C-terminal domain-containing protein, partial [Clostridia bacterium]